MNQETSHVLTVEDATMQIVANLAGPPPELRRFSDWLARNANVDVADVLAQALRDLRQQGRLLDHAALQVYKRTTVLNLFISHWVRVFKGRSCDDLARAHPQDQDLLEQAILLVADGKAFEKQISRLVRKPETCRRALGTADGFEGFVVERSRQIAQRVLDNFDTRRGERAAVNYLCRVAVSQYLKRCIHSPVEGAKDSLIEYLRKSTRLAPRTKIAIKLALLPLALTKAEWKFIRDRFGWEVLTARKYKVKEIAKRLKYKNPAVLSTKLYKARRWARRREDKFEPL